MNREPEFVLIVEPDNDLVALFNAHFATITDFKHTIATTAKEAIELALKQRPRVIVMEVRLPDAWGGDVLLELQSYSRTANIPIIFLAGAEDIKMGTELLRAGARDVVTKPVDVAELGLRIRNTLRSSLNEIYLHPQTQLPSGTAVENALKKLEQKPNLSLLRLGVQNFEIFKDIHGFVSANDVVRFIGNVIQDVIQEQGNSDDFIGHLNEIDFLIVTHHDKVGEIKETLQTRLSGQILQFHNFIERDRGYMAIREDDNALEPVALMQIDIEVMS